jgi:hypothetical protein
MFSMGDREVQLIRIIDKVSVRALLVSLAERHLIDFKTLWQSKMTLADEDQYWDWQRKQQIYLSSSNTMFEGYAVECEQKTQGMMILKVGGERSRVEPDRKIVYVHSLATAPWNRSPLVQAELSSSADPSGFRSVGRVLLQFAQFRSISLGYEGLVGLHSLPTAEEFYRRMQMIDGGTDAEKDHLRYFEWYRPSVVSEV